MLAANHFSQTVTGALIVIEREIGLRTFIESGVPLDANLSYDLLVTIFRPSAPLHDGAVIVQKGRIAAAACFLPLSMNPVLSTQFGTRHRAAIGITEETDAISVVVSEETGSISIAVGGANRARHYGGVFARAAERSAAALRAGGDLADHHYRSRLVVRRARRRAPEPRSGPRRRSGALTMFDSLRKFFRKYVLKNLALKMVSLAIAILLWWAVGRDPTIEIPMTVPLEFHHAPDNLEMNSDDPLQAQITLRGPERLLRQIDPSEVHAILDLQGAVPGERTFDLTPKADPRAAQRRSRADGAVAVSHQLRSQRHADGAGAAAHDWHVVERIWHNRGDGRSRA